MSTSSNAQSRLCYDLEVTIADGETTSNAIATFGTNIVALITDANLDGTSFTFLASNSLAGTYLPLKDLKTGVAASGIVAASGYYATDPKDFSSAQFIKIVSNAAQSGADTVITLATRILS